MATDGTVEAQWIFDQIKTLCGGRVWEVKVPDSEAAAITADGGVKPHIILSVAEPFSSNRERGLNQDEGEQPHVASYMVTAIGASMDDVKAVMKEVRTRLIGQSPSASSTTLRATGGFSYPSRDLAAAPSRVSRSLYLRHTINLAG
jgi:hypothetical protein